jgi:hypothetical protein
MKNARLLRQLCHLTPGEIRRFVHFVESPHFNQNTRLVRLAQYLHRAYPTFPDPMVHKQVLFEVAFGTQAPFEEQPVHDQLSQLLRLLEQFLAQLDFEQDEMAQQRHLLRGLQQRHLLDHFERIQRKALATEAEEVAWNEGQYYHQFEVHKLTEWAIRQSKTRQGNNALAEAARNLDVFYLAARLRLSCELINRRHVINADHDADLGDYLIEFLQEEGSAYLNRPAVAIYYRIYLTLTEPQDETHYRELVALLSRHGSDFPRSEAYQMYALAQNYCIRRSNEGKLEYLQELFRLYQQLLDTEILLDGGTLAHEHYKNIATVGRRLREFDWLKEFLEKYKTKLHPDYQENAYIYNMAAYHFEQQHYHEAMKLLIQVEFTDVFYHLSAKGMLLQIYYEMKDEDALKYHMQAFRAFLKRHKQLPKQRVQREINLMRLLKKTYQLWKRQAFLTPEEKAARLSALKEQIDHTEGISHAAWLRAKVHELEQMP